VREAIFNILAGRVDGARVLDLYAGTGALGIEALSRGATRATFVEGEAACVEAILQSLSRTGFAAQGSVLRGRLPAALARLEAGAFDVVFLDPPYQDESAEDTLMGVPRLLAGGGIVVYEHRSRYNPPERVAGLRMGDRRVYGDSAVAIYAAMEGE